MMSEHSLLIFFLGVAFVLAPLMTKRFFLSDSVLYSDAHKVTLLILGVAASFELKSAMIVWPVFCLLGFGLCLWRSRSQLFSLKGVATLLPFVFSLISALWFFSGVYDLHLLGYNREWSFYAALHGIFLGWLFVGCLAYLAQKSKTPLLYYGGCYFCFVCFLLIAFGIDGVPFIKRFGVVGLFIAVPTFVGHYALELRKRFRASTWLAILSLCAVVASMSLALLNEFWVEAPRIVYGISTMVLTHGFLNAVIAIPCFVLAIRLQQKAQLALPHSEASVVFFDGYCVLCNHTVQVLMKLDQQLVLKYSSLQGKYAQQVLSPQRIEAADSVVFLDEGISYEKAQAAVQVLKKLGGLYWLMGFIASLAPLFISNFLYDLVARTRYRIFGKTETCFMPSPEERELLIP